MEHSIYRGARALIVAASMLYLWAQSPPMAAAESLRPGLVGQQFGEATFSRAQNMTRLMVLDETWGREDQYGNEWSARWQGFIEAPASGSILFHGETDKGVEICIADQTVLAIRSGQGRATGTVAMEQGRRYPIEIRFVNEQGQEAHLKVGWSWSGGAAAAIPAERLWHSEEQAQAALVRRQEDREENDGSFRTIAEPEKTPNEEMYSRNQGRDPSADLEALPEVPPQFTVRLVAREPVVRNPSALAFDPRRRLFIGQGPQYRNPEPESPKDSIVILEDGDGDGVAERAKTFATGFNCIQGLAWRGGDLYVANSPDLTVVRDLDGDDEADEYVKVYTDLGNLEHGLHGLNFAPDGRLYMSKGNSKGLSQRGRVAPKPFRELWGINGPAGSPDLPPPQTFVKGEYRATYHDPEDDWGREGGVLRADPDGMNLEVFARGLRNPWDITVSDTFDWLGTDNDQTPGDRIVSPFFGAHFGWNHVWSSSWTGEDHPPTTPVSGPLFDGSGTGVLFYDQAAFPGEYRDVFFIGDWLRKIVSVYRPRWEGAHLVPEGGEPQVFIRGREALFRPTDIEVGPDGALYILGWGTGYGSEWKDGQFINEGRVFRVAAKESAQVRAGRPAKPLSRWSPRELVEEFGRALPVWRINAAEELVRRGRGVVDELRTALRSDQLTVAQQTWTAWTLGRIAPEDASGDEFFLAQLKSPDTGFNLRLQAARILGDRAARSGRELSAGVAVMLGAGEPRLRLAALQAIRQARAKRLTDGVWRMLPAENDRIVFYAAWGVLKDLLSAEALKAHLGDSDAQVRRAALLALLEARALLPESVQPFLRDEDATNARLARLFLENSGVIEPAKTSEVAGGGQAPVGLISPPLEIPERVTRLEETSALVGEGDPRRGEALFMGEGGASCWTCHRVGGRGHSFGPDLTTIGDRNDPRHLVESILAPNAIVTEGFATILVSTRDASDISGLLLEETDSLLLLAQASGPPIRIRKSRLTNRQSLHSSPMPSYAEVLKPREVANLVAFLLAQRSAAGNSGAGAGDRKLSFGSHDGQVVVRVGEMPFATYFYQHDKVRRPFLAHVRALSGTQVTRNFPPQAGMDAMDHDTMHPGIWLGLGDVSGADFWRNRGVVEHAGFVKAPSADGPSGGFTVINRYLHEGSALAEETVEWRFEVHDKGVQIIYDSRWKPAKEEFYFGDQEEMGLGIRVVTPLAVRNGGWMLDSSGRRNEKEIWGKTPDWVAYGGRVEDETVGLMIMPSPANFRPSWMHARDYGFIAANPFGRKAFTKEEPSRVVVKRGDMFGLRYGIFVFSTEQREPDFDGIYQAFLEQEGRRQD